MKVKIKTKEIRITLYFPTSLVLNYFGVSIGLYMAKKYVSIADVEKSEIVKQLKQCKKQYKKLTLVEVRTSEGEEVEVTL